MSTATDLDFLGNARFELLGRLGGDGNEGALFMARDRELGGRVALKVLRAWEPDALLAFKTEFRALQELAHPNVVGLGELFEERGQWFFTMELVEGKDFLSYVRGDEPRLRDALGQLARGLVAMHEQDIVHRDVRASNVLVTREGRVVVTGIAQRAGGTRDAAADWRDVGALVMEALREMGGRRAPRDLHALAIDLLRTDPGERPRGRDVLRRLNAEDPLLDSGGWRDSAPSLFAHTTLFVGRREELAVCEAAFERVREGNPVTICVRGESGVGKSALVRAFTQRLVASRGAVVLTGRCYERESVPFKGFDGIVDALSLRLSRIPAEEVEAMTPDDAGLLAQIFPVLRRVHPFADAPAPNDGEDPQLHRFRMFAALRHLLFELAERRPLVIVVDDLQWTDPDSLALLREVMRPPGAPALLLIATMRDDSAFDLATGAGTATSAPLEVVEIALQRLPAPEARVLAEELLERLEVDPASASRIAIESGGHPLFIDELVRHSVVSGSSSQSGAGAALEDALWSRIELLDRAPRAVLEVVALAGIPLAAETAAYAAEVDLTELKKLASYLRVAHLVRTSGSSRRETIEPYHDRVRAAVLAHLDPNTQRAWHARLAVALETTRPSGGADPELLAAHWLDAGRADRAARYTTEAAAQASAALAFDRAARLYRSAIALFASTPDLAAVIDPRPLKAKLGDVLSKAGRGKEAAEAFLEAAALSERGTGGGLSRIEALELRRRALEQYLSSGHLEEGTRVLEHVLPQVGLSFPATPGAALAQFLVGRARALVRGTRFRERDAGAIPPADLTRIDLCWSVSKGLGMVDPIRGAVFQTRQLLYALDAGEPFRVARALASEACYSAIGGGHTRQRTAALVREVGKLAERLAHPYSLGMAIFADSMTANMEGRFKLSLAVGIKAERIFRERCTDVAWELDTLNTYHLWNLFHLGRLRELGHRLPGVLADADARGDRYAAAHLRSGLFSIAWLVADDPQGARRAAEEALREWPNEWVHLAHFWDLIALSMIDLYDGRAHDARARILGRWDALDDAKIFRVQFPRIKMLAARGRASLAAASVERSELQRARLFKDVERDAKLIEREEMAWASPKATMLRAGLASQRGAFNDAVRLYGASAEAFDAADMTMHAHVARWRQGELAGGQEGARLIERVREWCAAERVRVPEKLVRMLAP